MVIVLIILLLVCIVFGGVYLYTNRETPAPAPAPAPAPVSASVPVSELEPEPVDCKYEWSDWSGCSTECGPGTISRTLKIIEKPQNGGKRCPPLTETSPCPNSKPCVPIDCKGEWDKANGGFVYAIAPEWAPDKKQCIYGKRYIYKQKAKHGGKECTFPDGYTIIPFPGGKKTGSQAGWIMSGSIIKRNDECPLTAAWDPTIDALHGNDKLIM